MYLQDVESVYDLTWTDGPLGRVSYGDVYHQNEVEMSAYNFEHADIESLFYWFNQCESESQRMIELGLPLPAYEMTLKASHTFNLLDARNAISVTEPPTLYPKGTSFSTGCCTGLFRGPRTARLSYVSSVIQ